VGIVVEDIERSARVYMERFGYEARSGIVHDPLQTAYVQFLSFPGDRIFLEFVSPDGPESSLALALKKGGGLNHICYSTVDIEETCRQLRSAGLFLIQSPTEAVAFNRRKIAWLADKSGTLFEVVEKGPENEL
jgi:catechol 2,3-dioxygenase-like lactoylglutathione lyase family enzyme